MTKKKEPRVIIGRQTHIMSKQPRTVRNQNHHRIITSSLISEHDANNDEHEHNDSQVQPLIDKRTAVNTTADRNEKHGKNINNTDDSDAHKNDTPVLTHENNEHDSHDEYSILNAFDYIQAEMNEIHDFINDARVI